jgi:hypothetical protein
MMNWKRCERNGYIACFKELFQHLLGGTEGKHKHVSQDNRCSNQDLNPGAPKYKAGMLNT